jgi:alkanesulfonate monooxygenase SsuD/methylene tetrahydromethanopterin reductase-like flavin-dependent oxidoreductase (luciferase family)
MTSQDSQMPGLLILTPDIRDAMRIAVSAEEAGARGIWSIEYYNLNCVARLAAFAAVTERVELGAGVLAAFARAPAMTASALAEISVLSQGRVIAGLGTATRRMNEDWYSGSGEHPAPRLTELVTLLKAMWAHEEGPFTFDGTFYRCNFAHFTLGTAPRGDLRVYTAGVRPRMVNVARDVAEGFIAHPIATNKYLDEVALPALERSFPGERTEVARQIIVAVNEDESRALRSLQLQVAFYCTVKSYDVILDLEGFEKEKTVIREAFARNDYDAMADAVTPTMASTMGIYCAPGELGDRLRSYDTVSDRIILYPPHFYQSDEEVVHNHVSLVDEIARM